MKSFPTILFKSTIAFVLCLSFSFNICAQDTEPSEPIVTICYASMLDSSDLRNIGYAEQHRESITGSVVKVDQKNFNQGIISDPMLLIQGRVAGLQIYNRGGDPNTTSFKRIRGLSTNLGDQSPLIVIDGIPGASLVNVDPNDIASFEILKDGSAAAIYGLRAAAGVILVTTKNGKNANGKFSIAYNGNVGISSAYPGISIMNADEFLAAGGSDLGADTDWVSEISQRGLSHTHGLALSGNLKNTSYRMAGNLRSVNGTLKHSGFDRTNFRLGLSNKSMNDKLSIDINAAFTNSKDQLGFQQAFRHAHITNPTAPVFGEDAPYVYNSAIYGGYFETFGLYDAFNPVSMIEQNQNNRNRKELLASANVGYQLTNDLTVNLRYAVQDNFMSHRAYYSSTSLYGGGAGFIGHQGRANLKDEDASFSLIETYVNQSKQFSTIKLDWTAGFAHQQFNLDKIDLNFRGVSNEDVVNLDRVDSYLLPVGAFLDEKIVTSATGNLQALFARAQLDFNKKLFFNASLRREGSSKLSDDNEWSNFMAAGAGIDLSKFMNSGSVDLLKLRIGYGITGATPAAYGLAQDRYEYIMQGDGKDTSLVHLGNSELKREQQAAFNVGLDYSIGRFFGALELYNNNNSDLVIQEWIDHPDFGTKRQYENALNLNTKGIELTLGIDVIKKKNVKYSTTLLFSKYNTTIKEYYDEPQFTGATGGPGQCCTQVMRLKEGEALGEFWGTIYEGVDEEGQPIFADVDGDGNLETDSNFAQSEDGDFTTLGSAIPDFELGWNNSLSIFGWKVNAFFRGAFGHHLFNAFRMFYEPQVPTQSFYNYVNTDLAVEGLQRAKFSSLYVENASFFKLDNLTLSRSIALKKVKSIKQLTVSLSAQNLFVITKYTGADPEPIFLDRGVNGFGVLPANNYALNALVPGLDRRTNYIPSRTISLGLRLGF